MKDKQTEIWKETNKDTNLSLPDKKNIEAEITDKNPIFKTQLLLEQKIKMNWIKEWTIFETNLKFIFL